MKNGRSNDGLSDRMLLQGREGNLGDTVDTPGEDNRGEEKRLEDMQEERSKLECTKTQGHTQSIDTSVIDSLPYRRIVILVNLLVVNGDVLQGYGRMVRCGEVVHIHNCRRDRDREMDRETRV